MISMCNKIEKNHLENCKEQLVFVRTLISSYFPSVRKRICSNNSLLNSLDGIAALYFFRFNMAKGEYITFIDDDDTAAPDMLEFLYKLELIQSLCQPMPLCYKSA